MIKEEFFKQTQADKITLYRSKFIKCERCGFISPKDNSFHKKGGIASIKKRFEGMTTEQIKERMSKMGKCKKGDKLSS